MNPLLLFPHRRDVILGDAGDEWLVRLHGAPNPDGDLRLVQFRVSRVVAREADGRPVFLARVTAPGPRSRTFDAAEAEVVATGSVQWDGITTLAVEAVVDSKAALWGLLAALEQARREAAEEMGAVYMDRFEYGKEKRRG